jgi:hypothetical protein
MEALFHNNEDKKQWKVNKFQNVEEFEHLVHIWVLFSEHCRQNTAAPLFRVGAYFGCQTRLFRDYGSVNSINYILSCDPVWMKCPFKIVGIL